MCYKQQRPTWGVCGFHVHWEASQVDQLTSLLTFLTVRPVEPIRTLTDSPFVTKASVSTPSRTFGCTKEKQGKEHALEARQGETPVVIYNPVFSG